VEQFLFRNCVVSVCLIAVWLGCAGRKGVFGHHGTGRVGQARVWGDNQGYQARAAAEEYGVEVHKSSINWVAVHGDFCSSFFQGMSGYGIVGHGWSRGSLEHWDRKWQSDVTR